jgi:TRAP transporter 4TM/12TM fusion protein
MKFSELKGQGLKRKLTGREKMLVRVIAVSMSLYQLAQSTFLTIQPMLHYSIHLTFITVLAVLLYTPFTSSDRTRIPVRDYGLAAMAAGIGVYFFVHMERFLARWPMVDPLTTMDVVAGVALLVFVIFFTKRVMGVILPSIGVIFLAYALWGHHIPGILNHRKLIPLDVLDQVVFTVNGVFSSPLVAASTYVFLFVLFGSFFAASGAGDFFYKFSMAAAGKSPGGAGKVAIITSGLFGMINGSPTANVVTTGSFTIPMMKRSGYDSEFSGAVTAVAATGGGIMPPIMGTAAFLMAEMAGIPYRTIALAGLVPGVLYYMALLLVVHFRAKKQNICGIECEEHETVWKTLKEGGLFLIPIVVLVVMLMKGYTASLSAFVGIVSVVVTAALRKKTRMSLATIVKALEDGALASIVISLSCAVAGCVIAGLMTTGLSGKLASLILSIGGNNLLPALILTAAICTLLGMGMPVAAAYALTAALCIPSLYELGLQPLEAHMFVVYFATLSAITPPVAVASYAAAGISEANASRVGWKACYIGLVSFLVPFMFVFQPKLMIIPENFTMGSLWVVFTAFVGVYSLSSGIEGYMKRQVGLFSRLLLLASGFLMMVPEKVTDSIGIALFTGVFVLQFICGRRDQNENSAAAVSQND